MGYLIAIVLGFAYQPIFNSKVAQGRLSLKETFWLYAVIIGGVVYVAAIWNFAASVSELDGDVEGALKLGIFVAGFYSLFVFLAVWRSSRRADFCWKWGARYISLFFLSGVVAAVMYSLGYVAVTTITVFLLTKTTNSKKLLKSTENKARS